MNALRQSLRIGIAEMDHGKSSYENFERLREVIRSPLFPELSYEDQHGALLAEGYLLSEAGSWPDAHQLLRRATAYQEADFLDWGLRAQAADHLDNLNDALASLAQVVHRWPTQVKQLNAEAVLQVLFRSARHPENDTVRFDLLDAMFRAGWTAGDCCAASLSWKDLALMLLERNASDQAAAVATKVNLPYALIGMRADKRFAAITEGAPDHFDIARAQVAELALRRAEVDNKPRSLRAINELAWSLLNARRVKETLDLVEKAIGRAQSLGQPAYDDVDDQFAWTMDANATALVALFRWEEAEAMLARAAARSERGSSNVSQRINLAELHTMLDRPKDALAAIAGVGEASRFGRAQVAAVRVRAAVEMNDDRAKTEALNYLRMNERDSPGTLTRALVIAGESNEAARHLLSRLEDPHLRGEALMAVQRYSELPAPPREMQWRATWESFLARSDVRAAIEKVGRVESYDIASVGWHAL